MKVKSFLVLTFLISSVSSLSLLFSLQDLSKKMDKLKLFTMLKSIRNHQDGHTYKDIQKIKIN